jgi:serine/threonine protein phosphatase PrpC
MNINVGAKSDVGRMRNDNQDSYLADEPVFAVADGVGGHLGGDVASATAVRVIQEATQSGVQPGQLQDLLRKVNAAIWEKSQSSPHLRGMGTTCTLVLLDNGSAHLAHVGDSRAYLYRAGELSQVTEDHNLVGKMVSEGRLSREEAAHHPQRNIITRALGLDPSVDVDLVTLELTEGDRLILCSDGLSSMIEERALAEVLSEEGDPQAAAERLVDAANQAGGEDNITVVLLDVLGDSLSSAAPQTSARSATPTETSTETERAAGWGRRLAWGLLLIVLLAGGLLAARWFVLTHAWFVGANAAGVITIYKGIPEEFAGVTLKDIQQKSGLKVSSLPGFLRPNVAEGIKVDSYAAAQATIVNLRQRAKEFTQPAPKPSPSRHKKKR